MVKAKQLYSSLERKCFKNNPSWFQTSSTEYQEILSFVQKTGDVNLAMERLPAIGTYTPLMAARDTDTIKFLRENGAQLNKLNSFGLTALDFHDSCVRFAVMLMRDIQDHPSNNLHSKDASLMYKSELEMVSFLRAHGAKTSKELYTNSTIKTDPAIIKTNKFNPMAEIDQVFVDAFLRIKCKNSIPTIDSANLLPLIKAVENGRALEVLENFSREKISPEDIARFSPVDDSTPYCLQELIEVGDNGYLFVLEA